MLTCCRALCWIKDAIYTLQSYYLFSCVPTQTTNLWEGKLYHFEQRKSTAACPLSLPLSLFLFLPPSFFPPFVLSPSLYLLLLSTPLSSPAKKRALSIHLQCLRFYVLDSMPSSFSFHCPVLVFINAFFNPTLLRDSMVKSISSGDWLQRVESQFHHP